MKKKFAIAKSRGAKEQKKGPYSDTRLVKFLNERIGSKPRKTATEVSDDGGVSQGYISELRSGKKDPKGIGASVILGLATGMGESPTHLLYLANDIEIEDTDVRQLEDILRDFKRVDPARRERWEYMIKELRRVIKEELRNP